MMHLADTAVLGQVTPLRVVTIHHARQIDSACIDWCSIDTRTCRLLVDHGSLYLDNEALIQ